MGRRLLGAFLACVLALAAVPEVCLACSCRMLPPDEAIVQADVVFRGRVAEVSAQAYRAYNPDGSFKELAQRKVEFQVETVWKGPPVPRLSIAEGIITDPANLDSYAISSCDIRFSAGTEYLVFGSWQSGWREDPLALRAYYCGATRETKYAAEYLQALGPGLPLGATSSRVAHSLVLGAYEVASPAILRGRTDGALNPTGRLATVFTEFGFRPLAIANDRDGHLYLLDYATDNSSRNRVLKFSPDGKLTTIWSGRASVTWLDEFSSVRSLAIDRQGAIYLSSAVGVRKLDELGKVVDDWRLQSNANRAEARLMKNDHTDTLFLLSYEHGLRRFALDGTLLYTWPESSRTAINNAISGDFAVDRDGNVYLVGRNGDRVQKFSSAGDELAAWGKRGDRPGEFKDARGIAIDPWGNIYVVDSGNDRVQQFSPDGEFVAAWGGVGSTPGQFRNPGAITIDQRGNVYVADGGNYRIQRIPAARAP
jgi:hypothetical protein